MDKEIITIKLTHRCQISENSKRFLLTQKKEIFFPIKFYENEELPLGTAGNEALIFFFSRQWRTEGKLLSKLCLIIQNKK